MKTPKRFEYVRIETGEEYHGETKNQMLNRHGAGGWELISVIVNRFGSCEFYFKKQI